MPLMVVGQGSLVERMESSDCRIMAVSAQVDPLPLKLEARPLGRQLKVFEKRGARRGNGHAPL